MKRKHKKIMREIGGIIVSYIISLILIFILAKGNIKPWINPYTFLIPIGSYIFFRFLYEESESVLGKKAVKDKKYLFVLVALFFVGYYLNLSFYYLNLHGANYRVLIDINPFCQKKTKIVDNIPVVTVCYWNEITNKEFLLFLPSLIVAWIVYRK